MGEEEGDSVVIASGTFKIEVASVDAGASCF